MCGADSWLPSPGCWQVHPPAGNGAQGLTVPGQGYSAQPRARQPAGQLAFLPNACLVPHCQGLAVGH